MEIVQLSDGTGQIERYADLPVAGDLASRFVDVWLPPNYTTEPAVRFPVIYMHDGQNIFDPKLCGFGTDWGVDESIQRLMKEHLFSGAIVVGVWNSAQRLQDYYPQKFLGTPAGIAMRAQVEEHFKIASYTPLADSYLKFLVETVKPFIDKTYRTAPNQANTFVMGSSMGGLISLYAVEEYPQIFGNAGCLSTHWPAGGDALVDWMGVHLPKAGKHRLYFDFGTVGLDADYEPFQTRMDVFLRDAGYQQGVDCLTIKADGADHNEIAWRARLDTPLKFLFNL